MSEDSQNMLAPKTTVRQYAEFVFVWTLVRFIGAFPRSIALKLGSMVGGLGYASLGRLRRTGLRNLEIAFPDWSLTRRQQVLSAGYRNLGRLLAEFCKMSHYTADESQKFIRYEGLEHYQGARKRGSGVLVLTGHLGAWELSSFHHSLAGFPMGLVIRRLDNSLVDRFVNRIRCMHGNQVIHKDDFARGLLTAMRENQTVGILMDTNMTPPQGVFVPFFAKNACTASGMARIALKTDATVLPGFLLRDGSSDRYILKFGEPIELVRTGNIEQDILANTAAFTATIERYIRDNPEQWLWMHRRWKTRPAGEPSVYS